MFSPRVRLGENPGKKRIKAEAKTLAAHGKPAQVWDEETNLSSTMQGCPSPA